MGLGDYGKYYAPSKPASGLAGADNGLLHQIQNAPPAAPPTPFQQRFDAAQDFYTTWYGPEMAALGSRAGSLQSNLNAANGARGSIADAERNTADIRRQQLDNQIAGVDIDRAAIPRQQNLIDQLLAITGQQKDLNLSQLGTDTAAQRRDWWNQVAAQGSASAPETGLKLADIRTTSDNKRAGILLDWQTAQLNSAEQKAVLADRDKQLELQAKNYGLDKDALASALQSTLARLNLDGIMSAGQVLDAINSADAQKQQIALQILGQANADAQNPRIPDSQFGIGVRPAGPSKPAPQRKKAA